MYSESAVEVKVSLGVRLKFGLNTFKSFRPSMSVLQGVPKLLTVFSIFKKPFYKEIGPFKILPILYIHYLL